MKTPAMILLTVLSVSGWVQGPIAEKPQVSFKLLEKSPKAGKAAKGVLTAVFAPGWHAYQNPPLKDNQIPVTVQAESPGIKVFATYPKGVVKEFMGEQAAVYEGLLTLPVTVIMPKKPGATTIKLRFGYQQCNDTTCMPPSFEVVAFKVKVAPDRGGG